MADLDMVDLCGVHPKFAISISISINIQKVTETLNKHSDEFWARKGPGFVFVNKYLFVRHQRPGFVYFYERPESVTQSDIVRALIWLNK